jgi:hypothetical protein
MISAAAVFVAVALRLAAAVAVARLHSGLLLQAAARVSAAVLAARTWADLLFQPAQDRYFCALIAALPLQWHLPGPAAAVAVVH